MAFVCLLEPNDSYLEIFQEGETTSVKIDIGHDDTSLVAYSLIVSIGPMPGGIFDLMFYVLESDPTTGGEITLWDGLQTASFLTGEHRRTVLVQMLKAARGLVSILDPAKFTMITITENLPAKALDKYRLVAEIIRPVGYDCENPPSHDGREIWIFTRRTI